VFVVAQLPGFGRATKLQDQDISPDGLVINMISFNAGVEIGQFLALGIILLLLNMLRASGQFFRFASATNLAIMCSGILLIGYQLTGYATT
jgi:hypothetical protein